MRIIRWVVLFALVLVAGCVNADPVAPAVCEPVDTIHAGPYVATVCMTIR